MWKSPSKRWTAAIFGFVLLIPVLLILFFGPTALPDYKQRLVAFITALLSACIFVLLTGVMDLKIKSFRSPFGEISIQSSGAVAVFIVMLGWWFSPWTPINVSRQNESIYRVRVTVVDPQQIPVEDAQVWSSIGGEPKKISGGWQFDIPAASKPLDGKLAIYALKKPAFLSGKKELKLESDFNPAVAIQLQRDTSAYVRGIVTNESGTSVPGARVSVVGHEESVLTSKTGNFLLPAHAAEGQQVQLRVEKDAYGPATQWQPAGSGPVTVVLTRNK